MDKVTPHERAAWDMADRWRAKYRQQRRVIWLLGPVALVSWGVAVSTLVACG